MDRILRYAASHKDAIYHWLRIGITVWMLFLMLIYVITSYTVYFYLHDSVLAAENPWLEEYYVRAREFVLHCFTATYPY